MNETNETNETNVVNEETYEFMTGEDVTITVEEDVTITVEENDEIGLKLAKMAARVVVTRCVGRTFTRGLGTILPPPTNVVERVELLVTSLTLGGVLATKASRWTEDFIDDTADFVQGFRGN